MKTKPFVQSLIAVFVLLFVLFVITQQKTELLFHIIISVFFLVITISKMYNFFNKE